MSGNLPMSIAMCVFVRIMKQDGAVAFHEIREKSFTYAPASENVFFLICFESVKTMNKICPPK